MNSDNARIQHELKEYNEAEKYAGKKEFAKLVQAEEILDRHFIEIAEALLSIDYSVYTNKTPFLNATSLNPDFLLQAVNDDDPKRKNFCADKKLIGRFYKKPAVKKAATKKPVTKSATPTKSASQPAKKTVAKMKTAPAKPTAKSKRKPSPTNKRPKK